MAETEHEHLDLLAFGAHPDDVEVGCAGLLIKLNKRGYKTGLVVLTEGEMGTGGTPELRKKEAADAATIMKSKVVAHLDLGDCRLEDNYDTRLIAAEYIRRYRPSIVLAPWWKGGHGKRQPHRVKALFHYFLPPEVSPTFVVDITDEFDQWIKALSAHRSQFLNPEKERDYLWALESMARSYGNLIGAKYGQGYGIGEPLKIEDPFCLVGRCSRVPEMLIEKKASDEE